MNDNFSTDIDIPWELWEIGDIVTRTGHDEQEIIKKNESGDLMDFKCIKDHPDEIFGIDEIESNIPWRYTWLRRNNICSG